MLPADLARDPDRLARFKREAQVFAALSHPRSFGCVLYEMLTGKRADDDWCGHAAADVEGIAKGQLNVADVAQALLRILLEALKAAHEQGIVHRELKPVNIKGCARGKRGLAVADNYQSGGGLHEPGTGARETRGPVHGYLGRSRAL